MWRLMIVGELKSRQVVNVCDLQIHPSLPDDVSKEVIRQMIQDEMDRIMSNDKNYIFMAGMIYIIGQSSRRLVASYISKYDVKMSGDEIGQNGIKLLIIQGHYDLLHNFQMV